MRLVEFSASGTTEDMWGLADEIARLGWEFANGRSPDAVIRIRYEPVDPAFRGGPVPTMELYLDNTPSLSGDDTTTRVYASMTRTHESPTNVSYGPAHVEEPVVHAAVTHFLNFAAPQVDATQMSLASKLLEALSQALDEAERLTDELSDRDDEIALLHAEIAALQVLANSLKRKLTGRRLGVFARCILDLGLGVGGNRIDAVLFEQVAPALQQVEAQCTVIQNEIDINVELDLPDNVIDDNIGDVAIIDGDFEP